MARVHVESWGETYRGLIADDVLDDPEFVAARERQWTAAITDDRWAGHRVAVAEKDGLLFGLAMAGPSEEEPAPRHLYVLYVLEDHHGSGAGAGLLRAVLGPLEAASLWVADPNPRAQAFYRKHGFKPDGASTTKDGLREIRMLRAAGRTA
jgi:GNAT superfamily N-acetyltransferase